MSALGSSLEGCLPHISFHLPTSVGHSHLSNLDSKRKMGRKQESGKIIGKISGGFPRQLWIERAPKHILEDFELDLVTQKQLWVLKETTACFTQHLSVPIHSQKQVVKSHASFCSVSSRLVFLKSIRVQVGQLQYT